MTRGRDRKVLSSLRTLRLPRRYLIDVSEEGPKRRANEPNCHLLRSASMADRADQYRQLAQDCLRLAHEVPTGPSRDNLMDMAREWGRLADEQDRATDLRKK